MSDRTLIWYISTPIEVGTQQKETYELDQDYTPKRLWCHLDGAPSGADLVLDVNYQETPSATLTTIFTTPNPGIQKGSQVGERDYFVDPRILKRGGLITLDLDQIGSGEGGKNLTVQLELDKT